MALLQPVYQVKKGNWRADRKLLKRRNRKSTKSRSPTPQRSVEVEEAAASASAPANLQEQAEVVVEGKTNKC